MLLFPSHHFLISLGINPLNRTTVLVFIQFDQSDSLFTILFVTDFTWFRASNVGHWEFLYSRVICVQAIASIYYHHELVRRALVFYDKLLVLLPSANRSEFIAFSSIRALYFQTVGMNLYQCSIAGLPLKLSPLTARFLIELAYKDRTTSGYYCLF